MSEVSLAVIETAVKRYAAEHDELARLVRAMDDQVAAIQASCMEGIKRAVRRTAERQSEVVGLVDAGRHLFVKPRTVVFHGHEVGLKKCPGRIEFDDEERVIELIREKLAKKADGLIRTEESVRKGELKELTVAELKAIGCTVEEAGDAVVVKAVDSEVEKVVKALLKAQVEE